MTAGDLALTLAAVLCSIGFAALIVVLVRVLDTLKALRSEVALMREETRPLLDELRASTDEARTTMDEARSDLERFDRVLGSAEAISDAVDGSSRVARTAFSVPVIKIAGLATGTSRAVRRMRGRDRHTEIVARTRSRRNGGEHDEASDLVRDRRGSGCCRRRLRDEEGEADGLSTRTGERGEGCSPPGPARRESGRRRTCAKAGSAMRAREDELKARRDARVETLDDRLDPGDQLLVDGQPVDVGRVIVLKQKQSRRR